MLHCEVADVMLADPVSFTAQKLLIRESNRPDSRRWMRY